MRIIKTFEKYDTVSEITFNELSDIFLEFIDKDIIVDVFKTIGNQRDDSKLFNAYHKDNPKRFKCLNDNSGELVLEHLDTYDIVITGNEWNSEYLFNYFGAKCSHTGQPLGGSYSPNHRIFKKLHEFKLTGGGFDFNYDKHRVVIQKIKLWE